MNKGLSDNLRNISFVLLSSLCIKVAIAVRGGMLKFTLVVDNDTTVHWCSYRHS